MSAGDICRRDVDTANYAESALDAACRTEKIRRRDELLKDFLATFLQDHVEGRLRNAVHYARYAQRWAGALGNRPLRQILPEDVARYVRQRQQDGMAPATINRELAFLRRVFNVALGDQLADTNPVRAVKLFKENNQRIRCLTDEEEGHLRTAIGEEHWPKVAVPLHTGFRRMNCFRLRWAEDLNFEPGTVRAHQPKGGMDYFVPMNDELRAIVRALLSRLRSPYAFPSQSENTALNSQNFINRVSGRRCSAPGSATSPGTTCGTRSPRALRWRALISRRSRNSWATGHSR